MKRLISALALSLFVPVGLVAAGPDKKETTPVAYPLTKTNGPWMVLVKSFVGPEAIQVANSLAGELREKHQIPAYVFVRRAEASLVQPASLERGRVRQADQAVVLAGDFKNEDAAKGMCLRIRKIRPDSITREMTSAVQWQQGVLATAFLVPNPLAPKSAESQEKADPLILKLNVGKNNLFNCPGNLTLMAMNFTGGVAFTAETAKRLEQHSLLEAAGKHAEQVTQQLRRMGIEAYVFHTRTSSLVAVGSFVNEADPRIETVRKQIAGMRVGSFVVSPHPPLMSVPKK